MPSRLRRVYAATHHILQAVMKKGTMRDLPRPFEKRTTTNHGGGVRMETKPQKREITSLPVVPLTGIQVRFCRQRCHETAFQQETFFLFWRPSNIEYPARTRSLRKLCTKIFISGLNKCRTRGGASCLFKATGGCIPPLFVLFSASYP